MKYKQPEEFFKYLKEEFGSSVFSNSERCLAIAADMLECEKSSNFLMKTSFNNKAYLELLKAKNSTSGNKLICIENAIKILTDDCCLENEKALNTIGWLAFILYPNEWNNLKNKYFNNINSQRIQNNDYIKQLQTEIKKLKNENDSLKKQLVEKTKVIQSNQTSNIGISDSYLKVNNNQTSIFDNKNFTLENLGLEMVYCHASSFIMGSPYDELGRCINEPQIKVIISKPFEIGKFQITQYQYKKIMENNPSCFKGDNNKPVEYVNWYDAREFCIRLNSLYKSKLPPGYVFALPTEAQWEYACRAGSITALNNGKNLTRELGFNDNLDEISWYKSNSNGTTNQIGQKRPNAWGIYDMHGNVWEWCRDWYGDLSSCTLLDPNGPNFGSSRVIRGGSWCDYAKDCRSATRSCKEPTYKYYTLGFRVALVPTE